VFGRESLRVETGESLRLTTENGGRGGSQEVEREGGRGRRWEKEGRKFEGDSLLL